MISGCAAVFILSSFRCAVLDGRNQLFETMKRGGAGRLGSVVMPQESCAMRRPVAGLRQGRRRERNIMVEIQKNHEMHPSGLMSLGRRRRHGFSFPHFGFSRIGWTRFRAEATPAPARRLRVRGAVGGGGPGLHCAAQREGGKAVQMDGKPGATDRRSPKRASNDTNIPPVQHVSDLSLGRFGGGRGRSLRDLTNNLRQQS